MTKPRVLIADDHSIFTAGLRKLLEMDFDLVGEVEDGRALLEAAPRLRPDVILLDISMPLLNGLDATRHLRKIAPQSKIIFLTMHSNPAYATEAFTAGASGYLLKRSAASELPLAIEAALKGQCYLTPLIAGDVLTTVLPAARKKSTESIPPTLTLRQREVLQLIGEGHGTKAIARLLKVSVKTVEFHKFRIMRELNLHSTAELVQHASSHGIITN